MPSLRHARVIRCAVLQSIRLDESRYTSLLRFFAVAFVAPSQVGHLLTPSILMTATGNRPRRKQQVRNVIQIRQQWHEIWPLPT